MNDELNFEVAMTREPVSELCSNCGTPASGSINGEPFCMEPTCVERVTASAMEPVKVARMLLCAAEVGVDYDVKGRCGRPPGHNYHRPDDECEDRDAHSENDPYTLHHPFEPPTAG